MGKARVINGLSLVVFVCILLVFAWSTYQNALRLQVQKTWQLELQNANTLFMAYDSVIFEEQSLIANTYSGYSLARLQEAQRRMDDRLLALKSPQPWSQNLLAAHDELRYQRQQWEQCQSTGKGCDEAQDFVHLSLEEVKLLLAGRLQSRVRLSSFDRTINELYQFLLNVNQWQANLQHLVALLEIYNLNPNEALKRDIKRYIFLLSKNSTQIQANDSLLQEFPALSEGVLRLASDFQTLQQYASPFQQPRFLEPLFLQPAVLYDIKSNTRGFRNQLTSQLTTLSLASYQQVQQKILFETLVMLLILGLLLVSILVIRRNAVVPLLQNEAILDNAPIGILQINALGRIQTMNQGALQMFQCRLEESLNRPVTSLLALGMRKPVLDALRAYQLGEQPQFIGQARELQGLRSDGSLFPIEVMTTSVQSRHGENFILLVSDLTEKNRIKATNSKRNALLAALKVATEQSVASQRERQQIWQQLLAQVGTIFDASFGFIAVIDSENGSENQTTGFAESAEPTEPATINIQLLESFVPANAQNTPEFSPTPLKQMGAKLAQGYEKNLQQALMNSAYLKSDSTPMIGAVFDEIYPGPLSHQKLLVPIFQAERLVGFYGFSMAPQAIADALVYVESVTTTCSVILSNEAYQAEQRTLVKQLNAQTQQAYQAQQAAEQAAAAKTLFLANMSHEIRTPMNAVLGLAHLLAQTKLSESQSDYVQKIHSAGDSLMGIINDILDYSKIESGNLTLESQAFCLEEFAQNQVDLLTNTASQKGLELLLNFDAPEFEGESRLVVGDRLRLEQVLTNLLSNALKFTETGYVMLSIVSESIGQHARFAFKVLDSGIGISEKAQQNLFQKFTQADESTTRKYGGTGLGLAISQQIVQLMGGKIEISSALGKGSEFTFTVSFPVEQAQSSPTQQLDIAGSRVLVLEDNEMASQIMTSYLAHKHCHVSVATDVKSAQKLLQSSRFDWVFLDWYLQQGDCMPVLEWIQQTTPQLLSRTFIVSATLNEQKRQIAAQLTLAGTLQKPFSPSVLQQAMARAEGHVIEEKPTKAASQAKIDLSSLQVLLVEDNALNQQIALEMLRSQGITVDLAENGQQAIERIQQIQRAQVTSNYDLVLMDLQMPVMGGHAATKTLREQYDMQSLPIIAMTAHAMPEEVERCRALGMNDYITKPIDPQRLYKVLSHYV